MVGEGLVSFLFIDGNPRAKGQTGTTCFGQQPYSCRGRSLVARATPTYHTYDYKGQWKHRRPHRTRRFIILLYCTKYRLWRTALWGLDEHFRGHCSCRTVTFWQNGRSTPIGRALPIQRNIMYMEFRRVCCRADTVYQTASVAIKTFILICFKLLLYRN